ncbi:MAG TPA: Ni/Fe hydrogenase subunit alpha [Acidothermaceae bacterium]
MSTRLTIDPITRIEGHARITIQLDDAGDVSDAHFHVTQFRGFEKLCEGRPFAEMPSLMARICGICPVSHLVAAAKACDRILAVRPPKTGSDLRALMNLAQIVQSHSLSLFYLAAPDLVFGFDSDPATRNIVGMARKNPQLAGDGITLRKFGQRVIEILGGKRIHPAWIVPGGVETPLTVEKRDAIREMLPGAYAAISRTLAWYKANLLGWAEEEANLGNFKSAFMAMVDEDGFVTHYDGRLRIADHDGSLIAEFDPREYGDHLGEYVDEASFLKPTYLLARGPGDGMYRVGTLARVVVAKGFGTPRADEELALFRERFGPAPSSSFLYHHTRLIEILHGLEKIDQLLTDPDILSDRVISRAQVNRNVGVGVAEAPRGTLMHRYVVDDDGIVQTANLMIATGHNASAMNAGVLQVAKQYVHGADVAEGMLNRVEAVIRCYDPCLSCSTHAAGQMPLLVSVVDARGDVVRMLTR